MGGEEGRRQNKRGSRCLSTYLKKEFGAGRGSEVVGGDAGEVGGGYLTK